MGMGAKPDKQYWREFISWRFWLSTFIADAILAFLWWGVSKLVVIMPIVRDVGFLVLLMAGAFLVAWRLPKWAPTYASDNIKDIKSLTKKPSRLIYDNVIWEDAGKDGWGRIVVIGPLCPKDLTPLGSEAHGKIQSSINFNKPISDYEYHSRLFCLECKSKYTLGAEPKTPEDSEDEVRKLFDGKRRREQTQ